MEKLKNFERDYKDSKDELQAKDQEVTAKIVHDLAQVIRTLGERDDYTMVFEKGSILWGAPSIDITDQVIRNYNAMHVAIGTVGEGAGGVRPASGRERSAGRIGAVGLRLAGGQEVDHLEVGCSPRRAK